MALLFLWQCLPFTCYLCFHAERIFQHTCSASPQFEKNAVKESRSHVASPEPSGMCCSQSWTPFDALCNWLWLTVNCMVPIWATTKKVYVQVLEIFHFGAIESWNVLEIARERRVLKWMALQGQFYLRQWYLLVFPCFSFILRIIMALVCCFCMFLLARWLGRFFRWLIWPSLLFCFSWPFMA